MTLEMILIVVLEDFAKLGSDRLYDTLQHLLMPLATSFFTLDQ